MYKYLITFSIYFKLLATTLVFPIVVSIQSNNSENTKFYLKAEGITYDMSIYDRWGNLIHYGQKFTCGEASQAWEPQKSKVALGVYVYLIALYTDDGVVYKYGTVMVI